MQLICARKCSFGSNCTLRSVTASELVIQESHIVNIIKNISVPSEGNKAMTYYYSVPKNRSVGYPNFNIFSLNII